jgi:3-phosphoshikimate 1-carboxyvinyltransferase
MYASPDYPKKITISPLAHTPCAAIAVPGSKSITNRALVLAALCSQRTACILTGVLHSEDTEVMVEALGKLGYAIRADWKDSRIEIGFNTSGRIVPAREADLFVANSGTSMRFLTALVALGDGRYRLDGIARMRERPIQDLLTALGSLGVHARCENADGCPPVILDANGIQGARVVIRGDVSSQFLSGLLLAAPWMRQPVEARVEGRLVSIPYVQMTLRMLEQWGALTRATGLESGVGVEIGVGLADQAGRSCYDIEPDASAASYFLAAAALTGGQVGVTGLSLHASMQGDVAFARCLTDMGCTLVSPDPLTIRGGPLRGIDVDMNAISDCVMTLAAVACLAQGPTTIRNIGHIRHKETDRIHALAVELRRLGALVEDWDDGMRIIPGPLHGASVDTYNDHRMAMSLALIGLCVPGITVNDPGCVRKTYPGFFQDLELLRNQGQS